MLDFILCAFRDKKYIKKYIDIQIWEFNLNFQTKFRKERKMLYKKRNKYKYINKGKTINTGILI
jgi:hypothetical protein